MVLEHGVNDIGGDLFRVFCEKEGRALDLVHALVYLVVADEKDVERQRPERAVQPLLSGCIKQDHAERDSRDDERPVAAVGYLHGVRQEVSKRDSRNDYR